MGIDTARFSGDIDEDLLCSICTFVLEDPVQVCRLFDHLTGYLCSKGCFNFFFFNMANELIELEVLV